MQDHVSLASFGAAFGAGVVSVLSPCVLPLLPAYLSLLSGVSVEALRDADARAAVRGRVLRGCAGFVAGFSSVFVLLGASATSVSRALRRFALEIGPVTITLETVAGALIALMGLHLMGVLPIQWLYRDVRFGQRFVPKSALGTFVVGAAFAAGWIPCVGPILGGVYTLAASYETVGAGVALLATYSLGLAIPFFAAAWSLDWFFATFARIKAQFRWIEIGSGALLVGVGVLVMTDKLTLLNSYFAFMNDWVEQLESWLR
ncbi:MAG: cytochrome c biogenesis CcdA family protein [Myxococcota bacterium]